MKKDISRGVPQSGFQKHGLVDSEAAGEGFKQVFDYQKRMFGRILWPGKDSVVRIVPGNDGTNCFPQVINASTWTSDGDQTEYLSDTFYMTQTLSSFGESRLDICSNLKPGSDEAALYPESPLNYFCNKIHRTMRSVQQGKPTKVRYNDKWRVWTGLQGTLPFPRATLMFQAICIQLSGRECTKEGEGSEAAPLYGVVGINNKASIEKFLAAMVTPMDRRKPIGADNNTYGALAEADGNILFLNSSITADGKKYLDPSIKGPDAPADSWEPTQYNLPEELCMSLWVPWEKVLKYMTVKEQLELIASEFGADTCNYVFSLSPQWADLEMPERIATVGYGAYGVSQQKAVSNGIATLGGSKGIAGFKLPASPATASAGISGLSAGKMSTPSVDLSAVKKELSILRSSSKASAVADALQGLDVDDMDLPEDDSLGIE